MSLHLELKLQQIIHKCFDYSLNDDEFDTRGVHVLISTKVIEKGYEEKYRTAIRMKELCQWSRKHIKTKSPTMVHPQNPQPESDDITWKKENEKNYTLISVKKAYQFWGLQHGFGHHLFKLVSINIGMAIV